MVRKPGMGLFQPHGSRTVALQEVLRERGQGLGDSSQVHRSGWKYDLQGPGRWQVR
jgi:hypothetical protein